MYINDLISLDLLKKQSNNLLKEKKIIENEMAEEKVKQSSSLKDDAIKILNTKDIFSMSYEDQSYIVKSLINKVFATDKEVKILFKK